MFKKTLCVAALTLVGFAANASVISNTYTFGAADDGSGYTFNDDGTELGPLSTSFNNTISIALFDSLDGLRTLNSITFILDGTVFGNAGAESLDNSPSEIELNLGSQLTASANFGQSDFSLVTTTPVVQELFSATAFDGVEDRAGTSGVSFTDIEGSSQDTATYQEGSFGWNSFAEFFTGEETVDLGIEGLGRSSATGSGNISTLFSTNAQGALTVVYDYTEAEAAVSVSEPGTMAIFSSIALLFGARRFKKKA
jgi:hypothetical protein